MAIDSLTSHRNLNPFSQRNKYESPIAWYESELRSIYSEKLNYYLLDSTESAMDTVVQLLTENRGHFPEIETLRFNAYVRSGNFERALVFADSLKGDEHKTQLFTLLETIAKLDTGVFKKQGFLLNKGINTILNNYASDSTMAGSWLARQILHQVNGSPINLVYMQPNSASARFANLPQKTKVSSNEQVSGINDLSAINSTYQVYPNPSAGLVYINYAGALNEQANYQIADVMGKIVLSGSLKSNNTQAINVKDLPNGIYFVNLVNTGQQLPCKKLVILK